MPVWLILWRRRRLQRKLRELCESARTNTPVFVETARRYAATSAALAVHPRSPMTRAEIVAADEAFQSELVVTAVAANVERRDRAVALHGVVGAPTASYARSVLDTADLSLIQRARSRLELEKRGLL